MILLTLFSSSFEPLGCVDIVGTIKAIISVIHRAKLNVLLLSFATSRPALSLFCKPINLLLQPQRNAQVN